MIRTWFCLFDLVVPEAIDITNFLRKANSVCLSVDLLGARPVLICFLALFCLLISVSDWVLSDTVLVVLLADCGQKPGAAGPGAPAGGGRCSPGRRGAPPLEKKLGSEPSGLLFSCVFNQ